MRQRFTEAWRYVLASLMVTLYRILFPRMADQDWVPLLDEAEEGTAVTVESIGKCTNADELRLCYLKIQEMPLTSVERTALQAAVSQRASELNISSWDFQPYDGGTMMHAAEMMQDSMGSQTVVAILDDTPGKPLRIRLKGSEAAVVSLNKRIYLPEILTDAANRAASRARAKQATWGEDEHPPMDVTDSAGRKRFRRTRSRAVLVPEDVRMVGNQVLVDARILEDTEPGRALAADVRAGRPVYFSTRAYGADLRVVQLADGSEVTVPMQMEIETWDRVRNPAFPDAKPLAVLDSVQVQAILDAVQPRPHSAPPANNPVKERSHVLTKEIVAALAQTQDGRRQLAGFLKDTGLTDEIRTAITDALSTSLPAPASAPVSQAVIDQAVVDAVARANEAARQAEDQKRAAKAEAGTFAAEQLKQLRDAGRFPAPVLDSIEKRLADAPDKATAEAWLRDQMALADSLIPSLHLVGLGYPAAGTAVLHHVQVRENQAYKPIVDNLILAFDEYRATNFGERPDLEVRKANKPFVDKLLRKFDTIHAKALLDASAAWNTITDSVTTADLWNQIVVQRALLEQAFGDADMLQFLGTDVVFEGDTMTWPVEYYEASGSVTLATGEMQPMARGQVKTAWIPFTVGPRRIATDISNEAQKGMASGPLKYNAAARSLYHIMAEVRRVINIVSGNEMLRASDAYKAVAVVNETVAAAELASINDATNVKYRVTLRRGGGTGALTATHTDRPVVRPRSYTQYAGNGQASNVTENAITMTINGAGVTLRDLRRNADGTVSIVDATGAEVAGFAIDHENGYAYVSDGFTITPGASDGVVSYSYATNFTKWTITPDAGYKRPEWYSTLLMEIDNVAALMARHPRYKAPNFALGSLTAMNYITQADLFFNQNSPKGTVLNAGTGNFVGSRKGVDFAQHNTQWEAGDRRLLLGRLASTKYSVRDPLAPKGPFPVFSNQGVLLPAEQYYVEGFDALITPEVRNQAGETLNPSYHTIILKA